jgi:hypothetical protein
VFCEVGQGPLQRPHTLDGVELGSIRRQLVRRSAIIGRRSARAWCG